MKTQKKPILTSNSTENVQEVEYSDTLAYSYLDYSVSTIVDRAVPDLKDGLKPVQRRVLYDMYDLGFTHDKQYRKTARVSGDVIGRFHAHGQAGVETAIVTMAQPFKKPITFIDGQGNWGSVEGDSPAAARYTECRLTKFAEDTFLSLLPYDTVDFQPNYDNTLKEPVVLPSKLPAVLITGAEGIAVGMRTNIPTFNLKEVIDANVYVLTHSKVSVDDVLNVMSAPDFSSGGVICNPSDMRQLYETGSGKVRIRAKVTFEPGNKKVKDRLVIEEVPYTMVGLSMISFMQDVVNLIESGDLNEVVDVVDQTGEDPRIVLELSRGVDVEYVKNVLFSKTKLEDSMYCNFLVVDNGVPQVLGVVDVLTRFCEFQKELFTRKYTFDLNKNLHRKSILEAYITCCSNIDDVVSLIKSSRSVAEARQWLYEKYKFTEDQANAVLSLKMSRLVGLEVEKVLKELDAVNGYVQECRSVLSDEKKLVRRIVSELNSIKREYGYNRKTRVLDVPAAEAPVRQRKVEQLCILVDRFMYVHAVDISTYDRNSKAVESDFKFHILTDSEQSILFAASNGNVYRVRVQDVPVGNLRSKGTTLDELTKGRYVSDNCSVVNIFSTPVPDVCLVTKLGMCKRVDGADMVSSRIEYTYCGLHDGDEVVFCDCWDKYLTLVSGTNRVSTVDVSEFPEKNRNSKGVKCMKFKTSHDLIKNVYMCSSCDVKAPLGWYGVKYTEREVDQLKSTYLI